jgi:uncharacterized protein (DUF427 family)
MARATFNGAVIAESDSTVVVEGNHYFPVDEVRSEYLRDNPAHSTCHWKGTASYKDVVVDGQVAASGAWYYPEPLPAAADIAGRLAFWRGVVVES